MTISKKEIERTIEDRLKIGLIDYPKKIEIKEIIDNRINEKIIGLLKVIVFGGIGVAFLTYLLGFL
jgi:hypothetical protein